MHLPQSAQRIDVRENEYHDLCYATQQVIYHTDFDNGWGLGNVLFREIQLWINPIVLLSM